MFQISAFKTLDLNVDCVLFMRKEDKVMVRGSSIEAEEWADTPEHLNSFFKHLTGNYANEYQYIFAR